MFIHPIPPRPLRRLLLAGLAACSVHGAALADARAPIVLCFERQEVLPWRTLDGQGLNFEMLNEVARRTGVRFDYQSMPWKRCLEQLKANQVDGAFAVSFTRARLGTGAYPGGHVADASKRMHVERYLMVRRRGSRLDWDGRSFHNLEGGRIGFQLGYSVGDFLRQQQVPVDEGSQRADELVHKLLAGRLAGAALGGQDAMRLARGPLGAQLEVLPTPLVEKPYFLVLSRALAAREPQLAARLWKEIEQVRNSPAYRVRERAMAGGRH